MESLLSLTHGLGYKPLDGKALSFVSDITRRADFIDFVNEADE